MAQPPALLGLFEHVQCRPVLDAAAGTEELELGENARPITLPASQAVEGHEGRVAYRAEDAIKEGSHGAITWRRRGWITLSPAGATGRHKTFLSAHAPSFPCRVRRSYT